MNITFALRHYAMVEGPEGAREESFKTGSSGSTPALCSGPPASSAASERTFSAAGCTITQRRTALDPDTVDRILFIKPNKQ